MLYLCKRQFSYKEPDLQNTNVQRGANHLTLTNFNGHVKSTLNMVFSVTYYFELHNAITFSNSYSFKPNKFVTVL